MTTITVGAQYAELNPEATAKYLEDLLGAKALAAIKDALTLEGFGDLTTFNDSLGYLAAKAKFEKLHKQNIKQVEFKAAGTYLGRNTKSEYVDVKDLLERVPPGSSYSDSMLQVLAGALTEKHSRARAGLASARYAIEKRADELDDLAGKELQKLLEFSVPIMRLQRQARYAGNTERLAKHLQKHRTDLFDCDLTFYSTINLDAKELDALTNSFEYFNGKTYQDVLQRIQSLCCNSADARVKLNMPGATDLTTVLTFKEGCMYWREHTRTPNGIIQNSDGISESEVVTDIGKDLTVLLTALLG